MSFSRNLLGWLVGLVFAMSASLVRADEVLLHESFDHDLSPAWALEGLAPSDVRVRDGALEIRVRSANSAGASSYLKLALPFSTTETIVVTAEITVVGESLRRGEHAGICVFDANGPLFTVRKENIHGYLLLAPGDVEFIGMPGDEGDPINYAVKYWPADPDWGPLRIILRGSYAHFQVGPARDGQYRNFFHSAIRTSDKGNGVGLVIHGLDGDADRWIRFDNLEVRRLN